MNVRKLVYTSILLALALVFGIIDYFLPFPFVPGVKLGLANIAILVCFFEVGILEAAFVDILKVFLVSLLSGKLFGIGFFMSLGGSTLSFLMMLLLHLLIKKLTPVGISAVSALFHSFGQLLVFAIFTNNFASFYYFPLMGLLSLATGIFVGVIADLIIERGFISKRLRLADKRTQ